MRGLRIVHHLLFLHADLLVLESILELALLSVLDDLAFKLNLLLQTLDLLLQQAWNTSNAMFYCALWSKLMVIPRCECSPGALSLPTLTEWGNMMVTSKG